MLKKLLLIFVAVNLYCVLSQPLHDEYQPIYSSDDHDDISEKDAACAGCLAVVDVIEKHMAKKSFDYVTSRVYDALDTLCSQNNYLIYDFPPPKMVRGCNRFIGEIDEEEVAAFLSAHFSQKSRSKTALEKTMCTKLTKFCNGSKRRDFEDVKENEQQYLSKKTIELGSKHIGEDDFVRQHPNEEKKSKSSRNEL